METIILFIHDTKLSSSYKLQRKEEDHIFLYFSGTGNSRLVAEKIAEITGDGLYQWMSISGN